MARPTWPTGWRTPPSPDPLPVRPVLEAFLGGTPDQVPNPVRRGLSGDVRFVSACRRRSLSTALEITSSKPASGGIWTRGSRPQAPPRFTSKCRGPSTGSTRCPALVPADPTLRRALPGGSPALTPEQHGSAGQARAPGRFRSLRPHRCPTDTSISMKLLRPLPARAMRLISFSVVGAWVVTIFVLDRAGVFAAVTPQSRDRPRAVRPHCRVARRLLPRREDRLHRQPDHPRPISGFALEEDGRLQMTLLGSASAATFTPRARVDSRLHAARVRVLAGSRHRRDAGRWSSGDSPTPGTYRLALAITSGGVHADRRARPARSAGDVAEPVAAAGRAAGWSQARTISSPSSIRRR